MNNKQKLELTWIGKDKRPKLEPRILLEDSARSYHARQRVSEGDSFDNRRIFGDNLLALKALEQELAGKVKCCFIDPPYNTGSAFTHYDDGLEHSIWLSLMRDRLEIIRRLLCEDASLWITMDDNGEEPGGITKSVDWKGGGFRYYRLAPSLLEKDRWGNWVVNRDYNAAMLTEALCKLEGFTYAPSETLWWQHGHSTERDFIWVTTQNLATEQLQVLSEEVGPARSLLVLCTAFRGVSADGAADRWPNLTAKKIPKVVLARCEWGRDDYSLNVQNLPMAQPESEVEPHAEPAAQPRPPPRPSPTRGAGERRQG